MPRSPSVVQGMLYPSEEREPIAIGTPAWLAWLKEHTTFTYQDMSLRFTARREQRPGGVYWYAYKRAQGKLLKRYLGRSEDLTLQSLHDAAQHFACNTETSELPTVLSSSRADALPDRLPKRGKVALLATKFHIPTLPIHYIARPRLEAALERGTKARLTLVCAPAGSGKTTLLAAWARTTAVPVAWLSLEEADDDPLRFLSYLMAAFTHMPTGPEEMETTLPPLTQEFSWEEMLTPFLNDLTRVLTSDTVLILDDYHLMEAPPIHAALSFLIEHAPPSLHLLIGTRFDPPLPLTRLRARGQLSELRVDALRFVSPEVREFLQAMELHLTPDLQNALEQHTQGWIVSIQLLALALRGQAHPATLLDTEPGTHPFFLEYVSEELLARLPAEDRLFLLRTSILDRLTGSLCETVTGLPAGQARLAACYQENLLISSLDDAGTWYSYHPLFAEALRAHLHKREPEVVPDLYGRASRWHAEHGEAEEACHYAFLSGDVRRAAKLLEELLLSLVAQGKFSRLGQWLDQIPEDAIAGSPLLSLAALWRQAIGTRSREQVEKMLGPLKQRAQAQSQDASPSWADLQSQLVLLRVLAVLSQDSLEEATILEEALRSLPVQQTALSQFISLLLRLILNAVYRVHGDLVAAEQILLDICLPNSREVAYPLNLIAWWGLAELYEAQGQLRTWGSRYEELFRVLGPHPDLPLLPLAIIQMSKATLLYEWNRLQEAAATAQEALSSTEQIDLNPLSRFSRWVQARIELAQGHIEAARAFLESEPPLTPQSPYPSLAARPARLALACGQTKAAWRWAEARRLRFDDPLSWRSNSFEYMTLARVLIARGREERNGALLSQALSLLGRWRAIAVEKGYQGNVIEIQMLIALALAAQGKIKRALNTLGPILAQAEPEGYLRLFADEGQPMAHLLAHISTFPSASPGYLGDIQAALAPIQEAHTLTPSPDSSSASSQPLIDPLTSRELEILRLLASGFSNQYIADQLVISLNTAKRHVQHILAKLGVTNRTQAVACARELHLL